MDKLKNILFILHFPPPVHGSSIVGLSIKNSDLINNAFECRYINLLVSRSINETGKTDILKIMRFVGVWFKLLFEIIIRKPDICYMALTATGTAFYKDVLLIALLRIFRIKRVYHLHNKGVSQNQSNKIKSSLYGFVFKNADIILLSKYLYKDIETFVPTSSVFICPNGISDTNRNLKPQTYQQQNPVKILFLSNLIESKGVFVLLDACSILMHNCIDFECEFIGAEGDLDVIQFNERVKQNRLTSKVKYLGKVYGDKKQEVFACADIFAFPTYYSNECFPLVILEAMRAGLPVISTMEGGIPDIVDEGVTGFLVQQKNVEMLAEKLEILIKSSVLRQQMGRSGRKKYENEFKFEIFEYTLLEILKKVSENQ
jgi:glycosyltransferase involved in cell wall biosynthesis